MLLSIEKKKINIMSALAMDGGPQAYLYVPEHDLYYGNQKATYFPNILSIADCQ